MHPLHLNCVLLDTGSGCASPLSIDGVAFGVGTWSTSRILTVQVGQTVLDRYKEDVSAAGRRNITKRMGTTRGMYATTVEKQATDLQCVYPSIWVNHQLRKQQQLKPQHPVRIPMDLPPLLRWRPPQALQPKIARHKQTCWPNCWSALRNKTKRSKLLNRLFS